MCYFPRLGSHEGVTNRFAAFRLNADTGYTPLMVKACTVAQTFASVHRSTGSLAPGAFVGGGTVLISAQPQRTTKPPLWLEA